jgi:hypothetical protein
LKCTIARLKPVSWFAIAVTIPNVLIRRTSLREVKWTTLPIEKPKAEDAGVIEEDPENL